MGDILCEGKLVEYDVARAIELYDMAAAAGVATAKAKAASLKARRNEYFDTGISIINSDTEKESDKEVAFSAIAVATAMGHPDGARVLAKCYANGFGTKQDRKRAYYWFTVAADNGDEKSYLSLGLCYSRGFGTAFSYKNATEYLKRAAFASNKTAEAELMTLLRRRKKKMIRSLYSTAMRLIHQKKYEQALRLLLSFENLSYPKALYTIGCLYEFGRGAVTDRKRANIFFERSYEDTPEYRGFRDPHSEYKLKILKMVR
jgi:TPR repeat protein